MISGLLTAAGVIGGMLVPIGIGRVLAANDGRVGNILWSGLALIALAGIGGLVWHFAG